MTTDGTGNAEAPQLKRTLGLVALTIYGIGNMLGAGIYGLIGKAAEQMGNTIWLAFAASMLAAGFTGLSYASLGSRYPRAGGAAYITQRAFNLTLLSYVIGLGVMASGLVSMATVSRVFADFFQGAIASAPAWVIIVGLIGALALVNFWGLRESAWLNAICTVIEAGGLVLVIAVGAKFWGSVDYLDATAVANQSGDLSIGLVLSGAVLTFFAFIGFEDLLNVSEEVKEPRRTFPIALVLALTIATLIYMAVSVTAVSVVNHAELARSNTPLVDVVGVAAPWLPPIVFSFVALFAVTNTALLNFIMSTRMAYGMSKQGLLPAALSALHRTRRTPHVAIVVLLAIVIAIAVSGDIGTLARATSTILLFSFCTVNAALVVLKLRKGEAPGAFEVPLLVPICGMLMCTLVIAYTQMKPLLIAGGLLGAIVLLYFIMQPKAIRQ